MIATIQHLVSVVRAHDHDDAVIGDDFTYGCTINWYNGAIAIPVAANTAPTAEEMKAIFVCLKSAGARQVQWERRKNGDFRKLATFKLDQ